MSGGVGEEKVLFLSENILRLMMFFGLCAVRPFPYYRCGKHLSYVKNQTPKIKN
jgi:hypothetical protein